MGKAASFAGVLRLDLCNAPTGGCNALAGVKARRWWLSSQSGVGRVTSDWQRRGGRAPYSAVLLCTGTTRYDTRWSSKLARSTRPKQEDLHEGGGESATEPQGNNVPFSAEKQVESSNGFKGIAL